MTHMKTTTPPPWHLVGKHDVFPEADLDEIARFNFLANMNRYLAETLGPGNKKTYETRVKPAFEKREGREPASRHEIRDVMNQDSFHRVWSALKRNTMEQRQQAGRSLVLRQIDDLVNKATALTEENGNLELDPSLELPNYVAGVDHHCMPGSYHTELIPNDISAGANYDCGIFVTTGGAMGRFSDGGGQALANFAKNDLKDFHPKRIVDVGCTVGHSLLPIAKAFPDAEVIGIDVSGAVLRYAAARAAALDVKNISFRQLNAEDLSVIPDNSVDWVQTTMFLHETSEKSMRKMMAEFHRILTPGGLMLHLEQPSYDDSVPLFEQFIRDWDAFNNNEPFWTRLHEMDLVAVMEEAGFHKSSHVEFKVKAVPDPVLATGDVSGKSEDHGRAAAWHAMGARKEMKG
ncbi:class I SAM-dependent methyltransferase [Temperatibacter marinus]|uniref:Class I SAM-dependent methyltransferase n=1 Tax=Temperatibacter marinus TaxID=1456591 RepID=A0AA52EIQ7_9PROT|nr:class I SAM-dependent methyltransferase [Temperatibacter marinus]WND03888.1 class I SAM-dependent methyltransferase [Temperatibacter marinus]